MIKNDYKVRALNFIKMLYPYIADCEHLWDYRKAANLFSYDHPSRKVIFAHGIARVTFVTSDYAVKIDYNKEEIENVGGGNSEEIFYDFAKKSGFAHLFAEVTSIKYGGKTFYIMPRVNGIGRYYDDINYYLNDEDRWFVEEYVYDMHCGNYGWCRGYPVIVDYASNKVVLG